MGRFDVRWVALLACLLVTGSANASSQSLRADQARSHLYRTVILLQNEFERSSEMMSAKAEARRLWLEYEALRTSLLSQTIQTGEYQQLLVEIQNTQQKLEKARRRGLADAVFLYSYDLMNLRSELRRIEQQTLQGRDELDSLRQAAADATARVTALRRDFEASIRFSPQFLSAKSQLEQSQGGLAAAFP